MTNPKPNPPPLYPIHTAGEARAMLHGAGAVIGDNHLWVRVPPTTPLMDLIAAGQHLGYRLAAKQAVRDSSQYILTMEKP